jgi:hypothetical protein
MPYASPMPGTVPGPDVTDTDLDRDGKADLIGTSAGVIAISNLTCAGPTPFKQSFVPAPVSATSGAPPMIEGTTDYDGDGRADLQVTDPVTLRSKRYLHVKDDRNSPGLALSFDTAHPIDPPAVPVGHQTVINRDYNGDGLVDAFSEKTDATIGAPEPRIAFFNGPGAVPLYGVYALRDLGGPSGSFASNPKRRWIDVNGDGLPDIFDPPTNVYVNRGGPPGPGMFQVRALRMPALPDRRLKKAMAMDVDTDAQEELLVPTVRTFDYCGGQIGKFFADGSEAIFCGAQFDSPPGQDYDGFDHSIFLWEAYKFRENADGTFTLVRTGVDTQMNLNVPVGIDVGIGDWSAPATGRSPISARACGSTERARPTS